MRTSFIFGLILILSLSLSQIDADDKHEEPEFADDDYYEDYEEEITTTTTTQKPTVRTRKPTRATTERFFPDLVVTPEPILNPCPSDCECSTYEKSISCRSRNLTEIPKNLPQNVIRIDLSDNMIETVNDDDFHDCAELNEINLNNNHVAKINRKIFKSLTNLRSLSLASNFLVDLERNLLENATKLKTLVLDYNMLSIPTDHPLLSSTTLEDLSMVDCNITDLYNETFSELIHLKTLNLNANHLDEADLNVAAFSPLQNLAILKISDIEEDVATKLCETLPIVDEISTTKFNVSCFELMSGSAFEDSTIKESRTPVFKPNKRPIFVKPNLESSSARFTESLEPISSEIPLNGTDIVTTENNSTNTDNGIQKADSINNILIGIIVVSACGLLIGVICRRDVCGIKTKMCRTKRPPPATPQNSTAQSVMPEEVPLNKITITNQ